MIDRYGQKRDIFLMNDWEAKLRKGSHCPGPGSGRILRFNILPPMKVLLQEMKNSGDVSIEEIISVLKCLDLYKSFARSDDKKRTKLKDTIDQVINDTVSDENLSKSTLKFISEIRFEIKNRTVEDAWNLIINRVYDGKSKDLSSAIFYRRMGEAFDVVFNLWPLITGTDIKLTSNGKIKTSDPEQKEKTLFPFIDYLKRELEDLLKNVFTKHLDISAATNRFRSEPILAEMVVEYCLNPRKGEAFFKQKLQNHLKKHYQVHFEFLKEYVKKGEPRVLQYIQKVGNLDDNNLDALINEIINEDIKNIISLIESTRTRLLSSTENNQLIRFIDPESIDVQIGDFQYEGDTLQDEEKFIRDQLKKQYSLAESQRIKDEEVEQFDIKRKGNKKIADMRHVVFEVENRLQRHKSEVERKEIEYNLKVAVNKAKLKALENLEQGNMENYAILSLIKAHHDGGIDEVERILEQNHNIMRFISPKTYHRRHTEELKKHLMETVKNNGKDIDPITMAMLFSEDFKNIVDANVYKKINETLAQAFGKFGTYIHHNVSDKAKKSETQEAKISTDNDTKRE